MACLVWPSGSQAGKAQGASLADRAPPAGVRHPNPHVHASILFAVRAGRERGRTMLRRCSVGWQPAFLALTLAFLLWAIPGAHDAEAPQVPQCLVAIGDRLVNAELGATDEVLTFGVLVSEDKVLVPLLAVTERSLAVNSGRERPTFPAEGGDPMALGRREYSAVERVPMHLWDAEAKKVHTMEAKLVAMDSWPCLALYQLPEKFPGRAATLYEGEVPEGLKVTCCPFHSFSLKNGPPPESPLSSVLETRMRSGGEAGRDWGIMLQTAWPMRGAGVFADGKLVGVVTEWTHYRIESSPSQAEMRGPAVYAILAGRIREFLKEQKVL